MLLDAGLFAQAEDLSEEEFSSPVLGRVYGLLRRRCVNLDTAFGHRKHLLPHAMQGRKTVLQ